MTFELTREQKQIQKAARDFVKGEFKKEVIEELMESRSYPEKLLKKAGELGFLGIHFPENMDGEGLGHPERSVIAEELARGHSTLGSAIALAGHGAEFLLDYGTADQKETWLPRLAGGEILSAPALADHDTVTTAIRKGDDWVISGAKTAVVNGGPGAGFYIVLCQTDAARKDKGWSTFLVDAGLPGVESADAGKRLGQSLVPLSRVVFRDVRVSQADLLGGENKGIEQVKSTTAASLLTLSSLAVGCAQGAFERALAHARQRVQFGKKLMEFQITRHKLADMATCIESARLMTRKAALACSGGRDRLRDAAMAKLTACRTAVAVSDQALQLFGGYGYITEYEIEAFYRDSKMLELFDGSPHVQKNTISENLFGTY